jgi:hypothetical protein
MSLWSSFINTLNSSSTEEYSPRTPREIYHTAFLLRQKLPPELVPSILDFAEYWLLSEKSLRRHQSIAQRHLQRDDGGERGFLYLLSDPIASDYLQYSSLHPVRKIIFTLSSRDQGWSDFSNDHGTRNNSWTWFDAVVQDTATDYAAAPPRRRLATNIHAGQDWEKQVITWGEDAEDEEESHWIKTLEREQMIGVEVYARFQAWTNRVRWAKIQIFTAAVR